MPRLRNAAGVVVNVDDDLAAKLDGYEPAEDEKKTPPAKKSAASRKQD